MSKPQEDYRKPQFDGRLQFHDTLSSIMMSSLSAIYEGRQEQGLRGLLLLRNMIKPYSRIEDIKKLDLLVEKTEKLIKEYSNLNTRDASYANLIRNKKSEAEKALLLLHEQLVFTGREIWLPVGELDINEVNFEDTLNEMEL